MGRADAARRGIESTVLATSDLLLAAVGLGVLCYPAITLGNALLGAPFSEVVVHLAVFSLAVGGAYPFVAGDWSYGTLWWVVFTFLVAAVAFEIVIGVTVLLYTPTIAEYEAAPHAIAFGLAYVFAALVVFRDGLQGVVRGR